MSFKKSRKVTFLPDWRAANPYQELLADTLLHSGWTVDFSKMPRGIFALNRLPSCVLDSNIIHIHWITDLVEHILWPQSDAVRKIKICLLYLDIILLRARGVGVIWTIHNCVSHESKNVAFELSARQAIARACSHALIHSHSALRQVEGDYGYVFGDKVSVMPHGNYDGCYSANESSTKNFREKYKLIDSNINIMFFGAVRRYKGVHGLVAAFCDTGKPNLRLIIAGKSNSEELAQMLNDAASKDPRIILIPEYIPNEMVAPMFDAIDAIVLPFEKTLTSGSTVLAMTLSKATILPIQAKVFDLADDYSSLFFSSITELTGVLNDINKQDLVLRGQHSRQLADKLKWAEASSIVCRAYDAIDI
jgi:beta-1,4-mannosyltransferase